MKKTMWCWLVALAGWSAPAAAQDLEDRETELEELESSKLETHTFFETQWHEYNNLDLRAVDESSDQAILDSDDRNGFAFTGISFDLGYRIDPTLRFVFGASHRGLWGNDQLGNTNAFGGWVYFTSTYIEYTPWTDKNNLVVRVGRQPYSLGGIAKSREYVLHDVLDMVRIDYKLGDNTQLTLIPVNLVSSSGENDEADFFSYISQSTAQTFGFRGDHMTRRHGAVLNLKKLGPAEALIYGFYTDIGALGSGSDISYNGLLGNFSDNDWVANMGARGQAELGVASVWASADVSMGIDRKELVTSDVDANGFAVSAGAVVSTGDDDAGFRGGASFFQALGPAYRANGQQYSHGYVGMKARHTGGTLVNRFLGWHPSAYVGSFGISDSPHNKNRKAGSRVVHSSAGYDLSGPLSFTASWWLLQDMGVTGMKPSELNEITPPYGYSREEFAAEERLGRVLGQEINIDVGFESSEVLGFSLNGAVFLPGDFYDIEIARVAGTQLGGQEMAWAINGGMRVKF